LSAVERDYARYASDATALTLTGAAAAVLLIASHDLLRDLAAPPVRDTGIELTLQSAPAETPPAPPPPIPPKPRAQHARVIPLAAAPAPAPIPIDPPEPVPADAALIAAAPAAAPPPAPLTRPDLEALYAAGLREDIDRRTHPPDSPEYRLRHPSGAVRVRFVVLRGGEPQAVAIERSSGSSLLDAAAVQIVASGHYPPMPPKVFIGEAGHTFAVTIEFRPATFAWR
jgi:periplasmic protein TonB